MCGFLYTFQFSYAGSFKKLFKKVANKKIANDVESYENTNLFQCINRCDNEGSCKIFNYNPKMKICQLTDQEVDNDYKDAFISNGWEVYIPATEIRKNDKKKKDTIEVIEFKKELKSAEKMHLHINATNLSVCFWIMPRYGRPFTMLNDKNQWVFTMFFDTDDIGPDYFVLEFFGKVTKYVNLDFQINEYYHICSVFSNSTVNLYVDGQNNSTKWSFNVPIQRIHAGSLIIGAFTGFLFDFNVFAKHFTQPQVQMVMKGKSKVTRTATWEDVKQIFKNVSSIKFRKTIIPKIRQVIDG